MWGGGWGGTGLITGRASYKRNGTFRKTRAGPFSTTLHHGKNISFSAVATSKKKKQTAGAASSVFWFLNIRVHNVEKEGGRERQREGERGRKKKNIELRDTERYSGRVVVSQTGREGSTTSRR